MRRDIGNILVFITVLAVAAAVIFDRNEDKKPAEDAPKANLGGVSFPSPPPLPDPVQPTTDAQPQADTPATVRPAAPRGTTAGDLLSGLDLPQGNIVMNVWLQACHDCMPAFEAWRDLARAGRVDSWPVVNVA